jgi:hypothetical protein
MEPVKASREAALQTGHGSGVLSDPSEDNGHLENTPKHQQNHAFSHTPAGTGFALTRYETGQAGSRTTHERLGGKVP